MDFSVVIPAYNEGENLAKLLERLREAKVPQGRTIVVDDGSGDSTALVAARFGVNVRRHQKNLGKGAAIATGMRAAQTENIVLMDGDNQHNPEEIPLLLSGLRRADFVIGSRFLGKRNSMPLYREVANRLIALIVSRRAKITDPLSGFRAFRKSRVRISERGFNADLELLFSALGKGTKVAEVPIAVRYFGKRSSKFWALPRAVWEYSMLLLYALRFSLSGR